MNWRKYTAFLRRKPVGEPKRVHRPKYKALWEERGKHINALMDENNTLRSQVESLTIKIEELESLVRKVEQPF